MLVGANPDIITGTWVNVHYKVQLGNYQWWERRFTAKFIYTSKDGRTIYFSGRPLYGDSHLEVKDLISMKPAKIHKPTYGVNVRRIPKPEK